VGSRPRISSSYEQAAQRFGLQWQILAGIGEVETEHGRLDADCSPNYAGARGPMQFETATFAEAARLAGIANPNICDPADAIPAAAALLAHDGAPGNWQRALLAYNPNPAYPDEVMTWANRYVMAVEVVWPLDGKITQGFGLPRSRSRDLWSTRASTTRISIRHRHRRTAGTPVRAVAAGKVVFAGRDSSGAVVVEIEHLPNVISLYGHLEDPPAVKVGDSSSRGRSWVTWA